MSSLEDSLSTLLAKFVPEESSPAKKAFAALDRERSVPIAPFANFFSTMDTTVKICSLKDPSSELLIRCRESLYGLELELRSKDEDEKDSPEERKNRFEKSVYSKSDAYSELIKNAIQILASSIVHHSESPKEKCLFANVQISRNLYFIRILQNLRFELQMPPESLAKDTVVDERHSWLNAINGERIED